MQGSQSFILAFCLLLVVRVVAVQSVPLCSCPSSVFMCPDVCLCPCPYAHAVCMLAVSTRWNGACVTGENQANQKLDNHLKKTEFLLICKSPLLTFIFPSFFFPSCSTAISYPTDGFKERYFSTKAQLAQPKHLSYTLSHSLMPSVLNIKVITRRYLNRSIFFISFHFLIFKLEGPSFRAPKHHSALEPFHALWSLSFSFTWMGFHGRVAHNPT